MYNYIYVSTPSTFLPQFKILPCLLSVLSSSHVCPSHHSCTHVHMAIGIYVRTYTHLHTTQQTGLHAWPAGVHVADSYVYSNSAMYSQR